MSIYYVSVGKNEYQVEINGNQFKINGEIIHAAIEALKERGQYLLRRGTWKREMHVETQGNNQYVLDSNGRHAVARVEKDQRKLKSAGVTSNSDLIAPMPGMVVKVLVSEGDHIEAGQVLVVLESMKMQMEMRSACAGEVSQVNAKANTLVAKGDPLVMVNPD